MMEEMREAISLGTSSRRLGIGLLALALIIPNVFVVLTSLSSQSAQAGWWNPRVLVSEDGPNDYVTYISRVTTDRFGNIHVVWEDGPILGLSGPDGDLYYRKWNATTQIWESIILVTDDNLNNTDSSSGPDIETDSNGNVHIVWRQKGNLDGSGSDCDVFWRMWNVSSNGWDRRRLISVVSNGTSGGAKLAADSVGNIHLAWQDSGPVILYRMWNELTRAWGQTMVVSENSTGANILDIAADLYGDAHVAWTDRTNYSGASSYGRDGDVFYRKLDSSMSIWGPIIHVNDDDNDSDEYTSNVYSVDVDVFGNVHIVWYDVGPDQSGIGSGNDSDVFLRKWNSTTGSWEPRVLVSNHLANTEWSGDPSACSDPLGNLHVVWGDKSDVDGAGTLYGDLFYKKWNDETGTWESTAVLTLDLMDQYLPHREDIACDPFGNVVIVWMDMSGLLGAGSDYDVYLRRYEGNIVIPDYRPVEVSPPISTHVLTGSSNIISAKAYNGGESATLSSTIAFYESPTPGSPFFLGTIPPLVRGERSSRFERTWTAPSTPGTYEITIEVDYGNSITEISEDNNYYRIEFIVEVPPPPLPPTNLTTEVKDNDDILLNWTASSSSFLDHYLVYRGINQREFDFTAPFYNTSADANPLRTNWTDIDAANLSAPREFYYVVRAVNGLGNMSITSNTAGKWTRSFISGLNAFSLPLEPFEDQNISDHAVGIPNVDLIRWMDLNGHWVSHHPSMGPGVNDSPARMGEGYEISLSLQTTYTFVGSPASMIRFQEGLGDSVIFRKSLSPSIEGNDVNLSWNAPVGADRYLVFRSDERDGLHDLSLSPMANTTGTYWRDSGIIGNQNSEHYYMVIPLDSAGGMGSSTYSVGVFTIIYQAGSGTFALPLKPAGFDSLDWFCDNIPNVVGMAYMVFEMWKFHAGEMPSGVYDSVVQVSEGFQISMSGIVSGRFTFVGW